MEKISNLCEPSGLVLLNPINESIDKAANVVLHMAVSRNEIVISFELGDSGRITHQRCIPKCEEPKRCRTDWSCD